VLLQNIDFRVINDLFIYRILIINCRCEALKLSCKGVKNMQLFLLNLECPCSTFKPSKQFALQLFGERGK